MYVVGFSTKFAHLTAFHYCLLLP